MTEQTATQARGAALNAAASAANARLKAGHIDEWNGYMQQEAALRGQEWKPRKTAEDREREEAKRLLEKYPDLLGVLDGDTDTAASTPENLPQFGSIQG